MTGFAGLLLLWSVGFPSLQIHEQGEDLAFGLELIMSSVFIAEGSKGAGAQAMAWAKFVRRVVDSTFRPPTR